MNKRTAPDSASTQTNTPGEQTDAANKSGQFGADKPSSGESPMAKREADKEPNPKGPEYEEGGQYPGKQPAGK